MKWEWNSRKIQVLEYLSKVGEATAKDIYNAIDDGIGFSSLCTSLSKYYSSGLLSRRRVNGVYVYSLTSRGVERLRYLKFVSK